MLLKHQHRARFLWAQYYARHANVQLTVTAGSSVADLLAFSADALQAWCAKAEKVEARNGRLTREERCQLHERDANFHLVTCDDILERNTAGVYGVAAIEEAMQKYDKPTLPLNGSAQLTDAPIVVSQPLVRTAGRERRARRVRASGGSSEDPGEEPQPAREAGKYALKCEGCGEPFSSTRPHTRTCSHRCRQRVYRAASTDPRW